MLRRCRRVAGGAAPLLYANLAVRGRLLNDIYGAQLNAALAQGPELVSIVGGGNDLLRPGANVDRLMDRIEKAVVRARATGADVLLANSTDPVGSPLIRATRGKAAIYYTNLWSIARRHGAYVIDVWGLESLRDWRMWAEDRIHLTTEGHRRVAQAALAGLGLTPSDPHYDVPLPVSEPMDLLERTQWHARWLRDHVVPWATRRLHRNSSGDERRPRRPDLHPID